MITKFCYAVLISFLEAPGRDDKLGILFSINDLNRLTLVKPRPLQTIIFLHD